MAQGDKDMVNPTLKQRRNQLTLKVKEARQEFYNIEKLVKYEVRKANPKLKEEDWVKFYELVENDPRYQVANARLLALCDAANIMGAEID